MLDLPVRSLHNILQTMVAAEVVTVDEERCYSIGPRTVALGLRTVHSLDVRTLARRPLQELAREIGDDVYLGLRVGPRVIYADRVLGTQRVSLDIRLGVPLMLHSTATGKLFAAFDEQLGTRVLAGMLPKATPNTITDPKRLKKEYPASPWTVQATPLLELIGVAEELRHQNRNFKAANQSLTKEINELNKNLEQLKHLDLELEQKSR